MRILYVEDDNPLASVVKEVLEDVGHDVVLVNNGAAALHACASGAFDVFILDYQLQRETGRQVLYQLLGLVQKEVPAIVVSRFNDACEMTGMLGVRRLLKKPFTFLELVRTVDMLAV